MNNTINNEQTFKIFLFQNRGNKILLYAAAAVIAIQFAIFKYFYPYINFLNEYSFQQLEEAASNATISITPNGYSRFLRLISIFTYSDTILSAVQYLLIEASALFFLFTLFYFYKPGKLFQYVLLGFAVFNPLFLHLANLLTRDSLFASLSMIWFALMLWIIHRPSNKIIIWLTLVLFLAFTVRHQAIIYLLIGCFAFWISNMPTHKKLAGAGAGLLLYASFITYQGFQYKQLTGHWQPAPTVGWLLANNSIYMYKHISPDQRKPVSTDYKDFDKTIRRYLNSTTNMMFYPWELNEAGNVHLWHPHSPLATYADITFKKSNDTLSSELKKWIVMAPKYAAYGSHLIRKYPLQYLTNYAAYGVKNYYAPPLEYLEIYYGGKTEVPDIAKKWFRYKSNQVTTRLNNIKISILNFYPYLNGITNVVLLFGLLYYWLLKGWKYNNEFKKTIQLAAAVWLLNALFTILLTTSALRLQAFPILLTTTFALLLADWMVQLVRKRMAVVKDQKPGVSDGLTPKIASKNTEIQTWVK